MTALVWFPILPYHILRFVRNTHTYDSRSLAISAPPPLALPAASLTQPLAALPARLGWQAWLLDRSCIHPRAVVGVK